MAQERPNIVLVMADDQGWGDMAYNGHTELQTPHFDQAAAQGIRFDRFYAAAPVCSPTRASVLTGRHPNRMGVFKWGYSLRTQEITLAEILQESGYATAHFGKWHLGSVRTSSSAHPGRHGFQHWLSAPNFFENNPILSRMGTAEPQMGESSFVTVNAALDWMQTQVNQLQPFLAVVWFGSPHLPHVADDEFGKRYDDLPKAKREFYGEISGMDAAFGKLRGELAAMGIRDNTILWYCSDNGALPKVGSAGSFRGKKASVYEGGLLVPAILEWPNRWKQPAVIDQRCNTCDILPTVLDSLGIALPKRTLDGTSLLPLLDGTGVRQKPLGFWDYQTGGIGTPSATWMKELWEAQKQGNDLPPNPQTEATVQLPNPPLVTDSFPGRSAWIQDDWKLHRTERDQSVTFELYHLASDPFEQTDVAEQHPEQVQQLQQPLHNWLQSVVQGFNGQDYLPAE